MYKYLLQTLKRNIRLVHARQLANQFSFALFLNDSQTMETLRPLGRSTIQPLYLNVSSNEATRVTTYYMHFAGPSDLEATESKGTVTMKGIYCVLLNIYLKIISLIWGRHRCR